MMELKDFIEKFAGEFEMTDESEFTPATRYRDLEEWDSLLGLAIIAMVRREYQVKITGEEIKDCGTIEALFNNVRSKM